MKLQWNGSDVKVWVQELAARFGREVSTDCRKYKVVIPEAIGKGAITAFDFPMGIRLLLFSMNMKEELEIMHASGINHPVHLHFSVSGHFSHQLKDEEEEYGLGQLSASLSANPRISGQRLLFSGGQDIRHVMLLIGREEYQPRLDSPAGRIEEEGIEELLKDTRAGKYFLFRNYFTLAVSECITSLFKNGRAGHANSAFVEGKALQLIGMQLEQYKNGRKSSTGKLKEKDLQAIRKAHEILLSNLHSPLTIQQLARQVGVNQQKLKKGFKELYSLPVNQYLRNLRLEKARALLLESDRNVREVAAQVGYSNASYFARRFKERYGMLPKDARK